MKLHILSDLHLEWGKMPKGYSAPECDAVILAGDISVGRAGMAWAMEVYPETLPVIYVCGNHELYGRSMALYEELRAKAKDTANIEFLENESVEIGGVRFIGGTLWTDFNLQDNAVKAAIEARFGMSDFRQIDGMSIETWMDRNAFARGYIEGALTRFDKQPCVVVTHHAPDPGSVPERFGGDMLNAAYASKFLQELPEGIRPPLWVHGHTHDSFDYKVGETRIVCNPRGYAGHELNPTFDPQLVVEIDT